MDQTAAIFLSSVYKRVNYYKELADQSFEQLTEDHFHIKPNESSNSIAVIIQHMAGNMLSRWTNFLTEDGEKSWRSRDEEFAEQSLNSLELKALWEKGWNCFLSTLSSLKPADLDKTIYIRSEPIIVMDAINRQLAHYPYHVGQIVYLARLFKDKDWKSLSIPPNESNRFNLEMKMNHQGKPQDLSNDR